MPDTIIVPDVHAAERVADQAAESAYLAQQSAGDDDVADANDVPRETPREKGAPVAGKQKPPASSVAEHAETPGTADGAADTDADEQESPDADQVAKPGENAGEDDEEEAGDDFDQAPQPPEDEFAAALEEHGGQATLDDIKDPVAKKLVAARLKAMESGYTRAMQDARSYRKDEITFRAKERFQQEHPVEHLVSLLLENPALGEQINERLEELESPTARKAHDVVVRDAKAQALSVEQAASAKHAARVERGQQVEAYAIRAAARAKVPYGLGIPEAIVNLVHSRESAPGANDGDISRAEVDQIITAKARLYHEQRRADTRAASKLYITQKTEDAATGGLKIKPGSGTAPGVGKKPVPKTDEEFVASFEG